MSEDSSLESPDQAEWYYMKGENLDGSPVIASLIPNPVIEDFVWRLPVEVGRGKTRMRQRYNNT